jgi:DNA-binding winged helix-turn-helix (wHTH) protein
MSKESVIIVEFTELYNILDEIKNLIPFNIYNSPNPKDLFYKIESNESNFKKSIFLIGKNSFKLISEYKTIKNKFLVIDNFPLKLDQLIDKINTKLIKQNYQFQSNLNIKSYLLNLNSRVISNKKYELKLTEKEIDIILFLNNKTEPSSVINLQNEVWGYSPELETHTVETHIYRLRKKIKDKFKDNNFITSHEEGYKI